MWLPRILDLMKNSLESDAKNGWLWFENLRDDFKTLVKEERHSTM